MMWRLEIGVLKKWGMTIVDVSHKDESIASYFCFEFNLFVVD